MSYHGYLKFISSFGSRLFSINQKPIKILEIGVDTGISLFALNNNMNILNIPFEYTGIDIKIQSHIDILRYTFFQTNQNKIDLIEKNSLEYLKECKEVFDIIMIDGDHNYKTVYQELSFINKISHENTLIICDDYFGRWSKKDLYYSQREGYEDIDIATPYEKSEKNGVGTAIDDFLEGNSKFYSFKLMEGEPICIINKENKIIKEERRQQ